MSADSYRHLYTSKYHQAHLDWAKSRNCIYRHYKRQYKNLIKPKAGMKLLELGCSSGKTTCDLAKSGCQIVAVDFDASAIALAKEWVVAQGVAKQVSFICSSADELDLDLNHFDAVTMLDFVEHVPDDLLKRVFNKIRNSGFRGRVFVYTPNRLHFTEVMRAVGLMKQDPTHINLKSESEWERFFIGCGFQMLSLNRATSHWPILAQLEQILKILPFVGHFFTRSNAFVLLPDSLQGGRS